MKVFLNDRLVDSEDAKVSVFDHGLLYGDGVFEGIRLYNRKIFELDSHLERLEYSAKALILDLPMERAEIADAIIATCRANELVDGYIRLVVTRGIGTLGLNPYQCSEPQLFVIADRIQLYPDEYYEQGLKAITVATTRIGVSALPPMIKSLNYLNNILAKIEAVNAGYMEAIMLNDRGSVAECTGDNIFIVHKGRFLTPPIISGALKGITRGVVMEIADDLGIPLNEMELSRYELWVADECFLTGTAAEVVPVTEIDGRKIGNGEPGEMTRKIMERFRQRVAQEGRKI